MTAAHKVFEFDSAILRKPGLSVVKGLRAGKGTDPHHEAVLTEHAAYARALAAAGLAIEMLEPIEAYPDSVFVEDPALVFTEGAILLRPGIESREGETAAIAPVLRRRFERVLKLDTGYVDGGDVLVTSERVMIGLSARTTPDGAQSLIACLAALGRKGVVVQTPADVLHFKSDCALIDEETVFTTRRLAACGVFETFKQIIVPESEEGAANALRVNAKLFIGAGFPRSIEMLARSGYNLAPLQTSEIAKIDAGLSCMSLRWHS